MEKSTIDILKSLCCDKKNVKCLERQCKDCVSKGIQYQEFDNSTSIAYWAWEKKDKTYTKNNIEKPKKVVEKVRRVENPRTIIKI